MAAELRSAWSGRSAAIVAILGVLLACVPLARGHIKPGAHADVRLSVTDSGLRVDCVMNLLFIDQLARSDRAAPTEVLPEEEAALREAVLEYFDCPAESASPARRVFDRPNRVDVDGERTPGSLRVLEIVRPEPETRPGFIQNPALLLPRVRAVVEYPASGASRVSIVWGTFPRDFQAPERDLAPSADIEAVLTHRDALDIVVFRPHEPEIVWHRPRERPVIDRTALDARPAASGVVVPAASVGLIGVWVAALGVLARSGRARGGPAAASAAGVALLAAALWPLARVTIPTGRLSATIRPDAAVEVFHALHRDIYRAFDFTDESDIYDALARSVDGAMLDSIYADVYHALIMQEEGGAMSRARAVTPISTTVIPTEPADPPGAFRVRADWLVEGVVYHWGHSHTRVNQYVAEYSVGPTVAGWRIVAARPLEQRRISATTTGPAGPTAPGSVLPATPWGGR